MGCAGRFVSFERTNNFTTVKISLYHAKRLTLPRFGKGEGAMHDVFVSYASDDRDRVSALVEALQTDGLDIWWDKRLVVGNSFPEKIQEALENSKCIVVCWSKAALARDRDWVRGEAEQARKGRKAISVRLDETEVPVPFNIHHIVDLRGWNGDRAAAQFKSLVEGIRARPSPVPETTRSKKRALIVGTGAVQQLGNLPNATANAQELARALRGPRRDFDVQLVLDKDKQDLEIEVELFLNDTQPDDLVFIYFAGHVLLTEDNALLIAATNSRLAASRSSTLDVKNLDGLLSSCRANDVILVFDACYCRVVDGRCVYNLARDEVAAAWHAHLGSGRSKTLLAAGTYSQFGWEEWAKPVNNFTTRMLRGVGLDAQRVDTNADKFVTVGELIAYLKVELGRINSGLEPVHWDFRTSSANIPLVGAGEMAPLLSKDQQAFVEMLAPEFKGGGVVPFFGDGIYGTGPLSFFEIARELALKGGLRMDPHAAVGIATAAESLELQRGDRGTFLKEFGELIAQQVRNCQAPAAYDMVLDLQPPWFIVSANYDDLLERRLTEAGRSFVLVTHVLRSTEDPSSMTADELRACVDHGGKMLVIRSPNHPLVQAEPDRAAEVVLSRSLSLGDDECIIYHLLGAPFINEHPFSRENKLDTVVATETDHIDFLAKLRNPETGVPKSFCSRQFRSKKLLFLEYNLDVWHYRLIGQLFRQGGMGRADASVSLNKRPYVVRTTTSPLEERFWKRFNPDQASIDVAQLVQALRAKRRSA